MKSIRRENGDRLEQLAEGKAIEILGRKNVEGTIDNFKRLSPAFKVREECGEIDLLCINPNLKMVFVFDCKNLVKLAGLYNAKRNVEEFYTKKNAYLKSLKRKKEFIASNLKEVLVHFNIIDPEGWQVQEAFIVTKLHYAAFYKGENSVFVQVDELFSYLKCES